MRAAIAAAVRETPQRIVDALADPVRRRNVASRCVEAAVGGLAGWLIGWLVSPWLIPVAAIAAEFVFYEYVAEPLQISGPYWERDAPDGERFTRP
jgi:hypothetical protein